LFSGFGPTKPGRSESAARDLLAAPEGSGAALPLRRGLIAFLVLAAALPARAAIPVLDSLFPAGGQRGTTVTVKAEGKFEPSPPLQGWSDSSTIHVTALKDPGSLQIQIDKDVPIGQHLIRLFNADGAAIPRVFIVGDAPERLEAEPNDEPRKAQPMTLPVTLNGQLEKPGDVDCYAVHLSAGETLVASVLGRRLGSPMDPMLHLLDPATGIELAFAHDGLGLDPLLTYRAPQSGTYVVRVSAFAYPPAADVKLTGGKADVYRLTLGTGPAARYAFPTGVRRGERDSLRLLGWNFPPAAPALAVDATHLAPFDDHLLVPAPGLDGWLRVEVGDGPELLSDNALAPDSTLPVPCTISGRIDSPGVEHRFQFAAKKGEGFRFGVRAGAMNSPLDALVRIFDTAGTSLATANGNGGPSADPSFDWTAPADGLYRVAVADLFHKGGPDYVYRLDIRRPAPAFSATIDNHLYRLTPGKGGAAIKVTVGRRDGHAAPLVAVASNLPPGVIATSAEIPAKASEATLTLTVAADAKPANAPIRVMVLALDPTKPESRIACYNLRAEKEGAEELVDVTDPWITVLPPPPPPPASAPAASQPATKPTK
jgi:hypothetical protein